MEQRIASLTHLISRQAVDLAQCIQQRSQLLEFLAA